MLVKEAMSTNVITVKPSLNLIELMKFFGQINRGDFANQRVGQAFCVLFDIHDLRLFSEIDGAKASKRIWESYCDAT